MNNYGDLSQKTNKYKEKLVLLQSIWIAFIKSKETRVITYTCRHSSGHLIPIIQSCQDGIKFSLEYLQVCPCFLTFYKYMYDPYRL